MQYSNKQKQLIKLYKKVATEGYITNYDLKVSVAFSDMEIHAFKWHVKKLFEDFNINKILDYGCGGANYYDSSFSDGLSAKDFFNLNEVFLFEPARNIDQRTAADAVICFDVLEHIFISDIPNVIRELFHYSKKLLIINIACYSAGALLPNGENAHITVRPPLWWKGMIDSIAIEFPDITVQLWCSKSWRNVEAYKLFKASDWQDQDGYVVSI